MVCLQKIWKYNDRCLCNNRRAIFLKYTHNSHRCLVSVCESKEGGELLNWKTRGNIPVEDIEEYPPKPPGGFRWDEQGFLVHPSFYDSEPMSEPEVGTESSLADDSEPEVGTESFLAGDSEPVPVGTESFLAGDSEPVPVGTESFLAGDSEPEVGTESLPVGCVTRYSPAGKARGEEKHYYRFQWKECGQTKHRHIKGGTVGSKAADARAEIVRMMIKRGCNPDQILKVISSW